MKRLIIALLIPLLFTLGCKKSEDLTPDLAKEIEGFYVAETITNDMGESAKWNTVTDRFYVEVVYLEKDLVYLVEVEQFSGKINAVLKGKGKVSKSSGIYQINAISEDSNYDNMQMQVGTNSFIYQRRVSSTNRTERVGALRIFKGKRF
jgi:hypothetical protein